MAWLSESKSEANAMYGRVMHMGRRQRMRRSGRRQSSISGRTLFWALNEHMPSKVPVFLHVGRGRVVDSIVVMQLEMQIPSNCHNYVAIIT